MSLYEKRDLKPMLLSEKKEPFDSTDFIYELKLDGIRCLAFVSPGEADLRNKRGLSLLAPFPELRAISACVDQSCVLDGELIVMTDGRVDFEAVQSRALKSATNKIELASRLHPASYVAFDILHCAGRDLIDEPLLERKAVLAKAVRENGTAAVSRWVERQGKAFFDLTHAQGLEGIVAKRIDSLYHPGKTTKDWLKIKNLIDEDFVSCGYIEKGEGVVSLILGQYAGRELVYQGHVTLGVTMGKIAGFPLSSRAPTGIPPQEGAKWFRPMRVVTVTYMERTRSGGMRQPRLKAFRNDKGIYDCTVNQRGAEKGAQQ